MFRSQNTKTCRAVSARNVCFARHALLLSPSRLLYFLSIVGCTLHTDNIYCCHIQIMEQWQVGPVPEYVYSNSTHPPNDMQ